MNHPEEPHFLEGKYEPEAGGCNSPMEAAAMSSAISLKRIADLLEVCDAADGKVITLPQIMLRLVQALEPTNLSGMNSISETLFGIMLNGRQ